MKRSVRRRHGREVASPRYRRPVAATTGAGVRTRTFPVPHGPLDLVATVAPLRQGVDDPTLRVREGEVWRALRTATGPATVHLRLDGGDLVAEAEGPGAQAALDLAPALAGLSDDPRQLRPLHPAVAVARSLAPGLRLTSGTSVFDAVVWVVLSQKVVGLDARRSYRDLVRRFGAPAPGGQRLLLPPSPAALASAPYWTFHECNVERRRATVVRECAQRAAALDRLSLLTPADARARLATLPGLGPWSAAEVTSVSHGDADAVPLGDYHIPNVVSWALAGEPRGDDARMLDLLEPYAGQRGRVIRLLMSGGRGAPRYGPRLSRQDIRGR